MNRGWWLRQKSRTTWIRATSACARLGEGEEEVETDRPVTNPRLALFLVQSTYPSKTENYLAH